MMIIFFSKKILLLFIREDRTIVLCCCNTVFICCRLFLLLFYSSCGDIELIVLLPITTAVPFKLNTLPPGGRVLEYILRYYLLHIKYDIIIQIIN